MSRHAIYGALILMVCAISAVAGISANYTGSATLPAPQNVTLSGTTEGIDVRWNIPPGSDEVANYQIAYQAMERQLADSWAFMWTQGKISTHLIRHLAGGYEYRVYVRSCSETQCNSEWAYGGTVWTQKPRSLTYNPVPTATPIPTATATPVPTPTPRIVIVTATPTVTPTPQPVELMLSCPVRRQGEVSGRQEISEGTAKNFEISFRNPTKASWSYGIKIAESKHTRNLTYHGFAFMVTESGEWQIHLDPEFLTFLAASITNSGYFDQHGIPFNYEQGGLNTLTFYARRYDAPYRFFVNGVEVPVTMPEKYAGPWKESFKSAEYSPTRKYFLRASVGGTEYTNFCMRGAF